MCKLLGKIGKESSRFKLRHEVIGRAWPIINLEWILPEGLKSDKLN